MKTSSGRMHLKNNIYFELFKVFAKVGLVAVGGVYTMLPIFEDELVEKRKWLSTEELMDYIAIGQSTPGIIAVNIATFVGHKKAKIPGGIIATLGMITPSVVIITFIAYFLQRFAELPVVQHAFAGIRVCVCVLILDTIIKLGKKAFTDYKAVIIFLIVMAISVFTPVSPILLVLCTGIAGIFLRPGRGPKKSAEKKDKNRQE